jgi:serine phosphatase RsbU (regulator of sigma subunit)
MGTGDILLLYTDGLLDHSNGTETYFPRHLEAKVREVKHLNAREIFEAIKAHLLGFAERADDISFVIIKR